MRLLSVARYFYVGMKVGSNWQKLVLNGLFDGRNGTKPALSGIQLAPNRRKRASNGLTESRPSVNFRQ
jgi:hypothetical protein